MSASLGLAMFFAALLLGRAAKIGASLRPVPWWISDNMSAYVVVPAMVTGLVLGIGVFGSAVSNSSLAAFHPASLGSAAVIVAAFVVLWRMISAWARRVDAARAEARKAAMATGKAEIDPNEPPRAPLKKPA